MTTPKPQQTPTDGRPRKPADPRNRWLVGNTVLAALVVLALGATLVFGYQWFTAWRDDANRAGPIDAATQGVLALMSVSPATIDADLAAVESFATGDFADELASGRDLVRESVLGNVVTQKAEVAQAAYAGGDSDSATVILTVETVTVYATPPPTEDGEAEDESDDPAAEGDAASEDDSASAEGDGTEQAPLTNNYRVKAEMALVDGQWLIATLEIGR